MACGEGNADSGAGGDTAAEENGSGEQTDEGNGGGSASGELIGGGASSQEAAMTAWTQSISDVQPDLTVSYDPVGSGSGREGFINGQYTFAGSDAAMDGDEQSQAEAVCGPDGVFHTPSYISPVAIAYNLPGVEEQINMDAATDRRGLRRGSHQLERRRHRRAQRRRRAAGPGNHRGPPRGRLRHH